MNDYSTLAERLILSGHAEEKLNQDVKNHEFDAGAFFEAVKTHILRETEKANVELHKRRLSPIERVFVPCYLGRLCLTFGAVLMCCVEFDPTQKRIKATIFGPPNRKEISRKEYLLTLRDGGQARSDVDKINAVNLTHDPELVANEVVSEILESGIRLIQKRTHRIESPLPSRDEPHFAEFWISLASLLRSYTALHGSIGSHEAEVQTAGHTITVRRAEKWLILKRHHAIVTWTRENGSEGAMEFTEHGTLRSDEADEAMDMVAEQWARELMHRDPLVQIGN